ncbi:unnamed protein product [Acanthocheilonema viteae]|uniref:C2H2-type domain-containing protein n=1 Tax=Acanthocheilonema viteae TaxID=6277 RepID=A0A498SDL1_ACAVI|nr:unnamed protein product [Acanthocheilonema viteae]
MTMEDMNACTQCGFMTNNFSDFKEHIEQHESERHLTTTNTSSRQEGIGMSISDQGEEWIGEIDGGGALCMNGTRIWTSCHQRRTCHPPSSFLRRPPLHHQSPVIIAPPKQQPQPPIATAAAAKLCIQKANMHRHRMRHTGVKPYQCRYCLKKFFRKDQMQEHSMTHIKTGADFDCPVALCDKQFSQHASLRTHLDEAHAIAPSTPASCKRCSLLFANSRRLLLHYQTKHDEGDTSNVVVTSPVKPKSENNAKDMYTFTSPISKKQRRTSAQTIFAAIQDQLKFIKQESMKPSINEDVPRCMDYEQTGYGMTNEEWLLSLSNVNTPALITDIKPETALQQLWTRTSNAGSENTEDQSHSPSVDSGSSSATDGEGGDKEQQECMHCGMIFMDQTLYLLHKGLHSDSDPWKCNLCGHGCGDKYMFTTHVISSDHSC